MILFVGGVILVVAVAVVCFHSCLFSAGVSRSVSIVIMHMMITHHIRLRTSYQFIQSCRPFIAPNEGFKLQLARKEVDLFGSSSVVRNAGKDWEFYAWNA